MNYSKSIIQKNYNTFFKYILCLIPIGLISGPFVPDLLVSFSALFFLIFILKNNNFNYLYNIPFFFFLFFYIIFLLLSLESDNISLSLESSLFYFRIGLFSCFIWYLIDYDKSVLKNFYYSLILCFSVLVFDGYYQFFIGENIFGFKLDGVRVSSFFGDELIMGSYLSRLFPLLFALFLIKKKNKFETYFIGLLFVLVDILIYLSGERTSFFFLNLSTIFIIILIKEYQKFRLATFVLAIILIAFISVNKTELTDRMFKIPAQNMGLVNNYKETTIFTPIHDSHLKTAFNMFKDKPIFGHGPKMFRVKCSDSKYSQGKHPCSTHPHNFYIQLLAETGVVGFLFLFIIFIYVVYISLKQFKSILFKKKRPLSDYQVALLAGILITVWPFSPNGNFFNNWLMIIYSLPVGFYLQSVYSKKAII